MPGWTCGGGIEARAGRGPSFRALHFGVYLALDQGLDFGPALGGVFRRRSLAAGLGALFLLLPLALTSTQGWVRRLGRNWRNLHRLVYPAAVLALIHYFGQTKADYFWPRVSAGALAVLLLARLFGHGRRRGVG